MDAREWALIAFTILSQMAVGSFIILGIVHFFAARQWGEAEADRLSDRALLAIGPVLVLGTIASLFHLGNPLNAYRAHRQPRRVVAQPRILSNVLFIGLGAIFAFMQWRKISTPANRTIVAWVAALVGLVLVFSMSQIYMLRTAPAWNTLATPVTFFTTTFLLGTLAVGAAYVVNYAYVRRPRPGALARRPRFCAPALRWLALAAVVLVGVHLVVQPLYIAHLSSSGVAAAQRAVDNPDGRLRPAVRAPAGAGLPRRGGARLLRLSQRQQPPGRETLLGNLARWPPSPWCSSPR